MTVIMLARLCDSYYVRRIMTVIMLDTLYDSYYVRQTLWQLLC